MLADKIKTQLLSEGMLNEVLQSSILKSILSSEYASKKVKKNIFYDIFSNMKNVAWDEIKDEDILKLTPENARKTVYRSNDYIAFWVKIHPKQLIGVTLGDLFFKEGGIPIKNWWEQHHDRRYGKIGIDYRPQFGIKELVRDSQLVYAVDLRQFQTAEKQKERQENPPYKFDLEKAKEERKVRASQMKIEYPPERANKDMDNAIDKLLKAAKNIYQKPKFNDDNELTITVNAGGHQRLLGDALNILFNTYARYIQDWNSFQRTKEAGVTGVGLKGVTDDLLNSIKLLQQVITAIQNAK